MIKSILIINAFFISSLLSVPTFADVVQKQVHSFADAQALFTDIDEPEETLLVVGFQDTLVTLPCDFSAPSKESCPYLGSVTWFDWQSNLLENEPDSKYLVAKDKRYLLEIASILLSDATLNYSEEINPKVLDALAKQGVRIMFLTQYDRNQRLPEIEATALVWDEEKGKSLAELLNQYSPQVDDSHEAMKVCNQTDSTSISYQNGVMYAAGQNKTGVMKCFLDLYNGQLTKDSEAVEKAGVAKEVNTVVFIDDSYAQIEELYNAYRGYRGYDVYALQYLAMSQAWQNLVSESDEMQLREQSHQQWLKIKEDVESRIFFE